MLLTVPSAWIICQPERCTHSPPPVPPYTSAEAQNLSSERIAPTDSMDHHPQNQEQLSICQSLLYVDLVSFPVLSQIKLQTPLLVVPFRLFLKVSAL